MQKTALSEQRTLSKSGISPDQGLDSVLYKDDQNQPYIKDTPSRLVMNFVGKVVDTPTEHAIPICKVWGIQFYVDPKSYDAKDSDFFMPAWTVPVTPKESDNDQFLELMVERSCDTFKFSWLKCAQRNKVVECVLVVALFYLHCLHCPTG